jgi:hypothetical protein
VRPPLAPTQAVRAALSLSSLTALELTGSGAARGGLPLAALFPNLRDLTARVAGFGVLRGLTRLTSLTLCSQGSGCASHPGTRVGGLERLERWSDVATLAQLRRLTLARGHGDSTASLRSQAGECADDETLVSRVLRHAAALRELQCIAFRDWEVWSCPPLTQSDAAGGGGRAQGSCPREAAGQRRLLYPSLRRVELEGAAATSEGLLQLAAFVNSVLSVNGLLGPAIADRSDRHGTARLWPQKAGGGQGLTVALRNAPGPKALVGLEEALLSCPGFAALELQHCRGVDGARVQALCALLGCVDWLP